MADNTTLPIPAGSSSGDVVRDIDRAGVKTQVVQLDIGGAAAESLVTGTMPVSGSITVGAALPAGANAIGKLAANAGVTIGAVEIAAAQTLATVSTVTNLSQMGGVAIAMGAGIRSAGTQRVTIATDDVVPVSQSGAWSLSANQSVNVAQMNGVAVTMGSGITGTGVQRVVLATDVALPTGANTIGALTANQSVNNAQIAGVATATGNGVTGTGSQRVTIASDNTAFSVNATPPTLTKATQGATGYSTQDLKDAGRVIFSAATVIAGVTAVTAEALLSMVATRDGVAVAGATTFAVTSGKRLRITGISVGMISTGATVLSMRFALRMNPSGAVAATSPILRIFAVPSGAALAQAGGELEIGIPDGIEFSGTHQFGITQIGSAVTGTCWASVSGFEY